MTDYYHSGVRMAENWLQDNQTLFSKGELRHHVFIEAADDYSGYCPALILDQMSSEQQSFIKGANSSEICPARDLNLDPDFDSDFNTAFAERRQELANLPSNETLTPYLNTALTLTKASLSQHVRIEALSTTITFCRKLGFGEAPIHPLTDIQKMLCAGTGAFNLIGTLSLTNTIEKHLGPIAEVAFDLAAIGTTYAISVYNPFYANKFTQISLLKGVAGGQIVRHGLVQVLGPVQPALTVLDLALNDLITSTISVGGSNYFAYNLEGGYSGNFFDNAQTTYRLLDIPLNYLLTMTTNACGFALNSAIAIASLAARTRTLDYAPNKTPLEIIGIAAGLILGGIFVTEIPWSRYTYEAPIRENPIHKVASQYQENPLSSCVIGDVNVTCNGVETNE
jgi:hypothetical protein